MSKQLLEINPEFVPYGPGPGTINGLNREEIAGHFRDIARSPAGIFYYGSLTAERREGNQGQTYYHDPTTGKTVNAMGLPNLGIVEATPVMKVGQQMADDEGKEFIVSVSPAHGDDPEEVLPYLVSKVLEAGVRKVEVNYSCPNKVADDGVSRDPVLGYDAETVLRTREAIFREVGADFYLSEKWPPFLSPDLPRSYQNELIAMLFYLDERANARVSALAISNTVMGVDLLREDGSHALDIVTQTADGEAKHSHIGGMSGIYVAESARNELAQVYWRNTYNRLDIISAGGVASGDEVLWRKKLGAIASVGVTAFWEGKKAGRSFGRTAALIAEEYFTAKEQEGIA